MKRTKQTIFCLSLALVGVFIGSRPSAVSPALGAAPTAAPLVEKKKANASKSAMEARIHQREQLASLSNAALQHRLCSHWNSFEEVQAMLALWASRDPKSAWKWVTEEGLLRFPWYSDPFTHSVIREWIRQDASAAIAALKADPADWGPPYLLDLLWGDPPLTATARTALLGHLDFLAENQTRYLQESDIPAIEALPPGPAREKLIAGAVSNLNYRDWKAALRYVEAQPEPARSKFLRASAEHWFAESLKPDDPRFTYYRQWFEVHGTAEDRQALLPSFVNALADTDAGAALALANEHLEGDAQNRALTNVMGILARKDADAALALAEQLEGNSYGYALSGIVSALRDKDTMAARAVAEQIAPGPAKDSALHASIAKVDGESLAWVLNQQASKSNWGSRYHKDSPAEFRQRVAAGGEGLPEPIISEGLLDMVSHTPREALDWAKTNAPSRLPYMLEFCQSVRPQVAETWMAER